MMPHISLHGQCDFVDLRNQLSIRLLITSANFGDCIRKMKPRRELGVQQKVELSEKFNYSIHLLGELKSIRNSNSRKMILRVQKFREKVIPPGSEREVLFFQTLRGLHILRQKGLRYFLQTIWARISMKVKIATLGIRFRLNRPRKARVITVDELKPRPEILTHQASVDIIICVHNALSDAERCLKSVLQFSDHPYSLILVDDGSDAPTKDFLTRFAEQNDCDLLRNEVARGYTLAANQGLRRSSADFVILLNSDTIVSRGWLNRLIACAESNPKIGLVGPLSNAASWQSIPEIIDFGDWAENPLPLNISIADMADWVAEKSWRLYPPMTFLNGFCMLIRREVIDEIGYFDEENFGVGYGEENDYCLRAQKLIGSWHSPMIPTYSMRNPAVIITSNEKNSASEQILCLPKNMDKSSSMKELKICVRIGCWKEFAHTVNTSTSENKLSKRDLNTLPVTECYLSSQFGLQGEVQT